MTEMIVGNGQVLLDVYDIKNGMELAIFINEDGTVDSRYFMPIPTPVRLEVLL